MNNKIKMCEKYARTMMFMAKVLEKEYGKDNEAVISYIKKGIKTCNKAIELKREYKADTTYEFRLAA